jgi:ATP phosphoribosyltransferase regulatory subunit
LIKGQLPYGVGDLFFEYAAQQRSLESRLRRVFATWAYAEIISPTLEYADVVSGPAGSQLASNIMRFVDRNGETLALRPDLTIPTARAVATKLYDQPLPLRLCYIGRVFRYEDPQAGRQREFTQAGFELIGAGTVAADAEVLQLAVATLRAAELAQFMLTIGHMGFYRSLLAALDLPADAEAALTAAIDRKRQGDLLQLIETLPLSPAARQSLRVLPSLNGQNDVFERAYAASLTPAMTAAVTHLHQVWQRLAALDLAPHIVIDFSEIRGMAYYTGLTFEGFAPGVGAAVCSGGRYDELIGHFGSPRPAVGCALVVDRLLGTSRHQGTALPSLTPDWLVGTVPDCDVRPLQAWLDDRRAHGQVIDVDLLGRDEAALVAVRQARGITGLLWYAGPHAITLHDAAGSHTLTLDALLALTREDWP